MTRVKPPTLNNVIGEYAWAIALGLALVMCMPLLGIAALMLQGAVVAVIAVAIAAALVVGLWKLIEPKLSPGLRLVVRDVALGVAMVASVPLLVVMMFVMQGTLAVLLAVAAVALVIVGAWWIVAAGRHAFDAPDNGNGAKHHLKGTPGRKAVR